MKKRFLLALLTVISIFVCVTGFTGCHPENGTYYLMENGKLKTEVYYKLNSGKWEDDDGANGTYKTENGKIRLYLVMFGEEEELATGTYGDGLLIFDMGGGIKDVYVSDAHTHSFGEWKTVKHNCFEDGLQTRECECGFIEEQTTEAAGHHTFGNWQTVKYNCLEDGLEKRYCGCGEEEERSVPAKGSHTFGDWVVVEEAQPSAVGKEERTCSVCGEKESRPVYLFGQEYFLLIEKTEQTQSYSLTVTVKGVETWYQIDNGKVLIDDYKRFLYQDGSQYFKLDYNDIDKKYHKTYAEPFDCNDYLDIFKNLTLTGYDKNNEAYTATYDGKDYLMAVYSNSVIIASGGTQYKLEAVGKIAVNLPLERNIVDDTNKS